jgi:hypothetical protein
VTDKKNNNKIMLLYDPKSDKYTSFDVYWLREKEWELWVTKKQMIGYLKIKK